MANFAHEPAVVSSIASVKIRMSLLEGSCYLGEGIALAFLQCEEYDEA
jgi:hypothetical protein